MATLCTGEPSLLQVGKLRVGEGTGLAQGLTGTRRVGLQPQLPLGWTSLLGGANRDGVAQESDNDSSGAKSGSPPGFVQPMS